MKRILHLAALICALSFVSCTKPPVAPAEEKDPEESGKLPSGQDPVEPKDTLKPGDQGWQYTDFAYAVCYEGLWGDDTITWDVYYGSRMLLSELGLELVADKSKGKSRIPEGTYAVVDVSLKDPVAGQAAGAYVQDEMLYGCYYYKGTNVGYWGDSGNVTVSHDGDATVIEYSIFDSSLNGEGVTGQVTAVFEIKEGSLTKARAGWYRPAIRKVTLKTK